jgi:hypothetical protein
MPPLSSPFRSTRGACPLRKPPLDCFADARNDAAQILSRRDPRPSFASHNAKNRFASGTHDPEKWCPVFGQDHARRRGRRSAERRIQPIPRSTDKRCRLPMPGRGGAPCRQVYAVCALICLRGALAFRRYTAALARTFTSWLSSRPCLLGSVRAGILPALSGSQSSGSTPRLGRSTEGNDAQSRSGAGCEPARKHRTRSTLQIASGMRPSMSEIR